MNLYSQGVDPRLDLSNPDALNRAALMNHGEA
jgi:hypothetical protein